MPTVKSSLGEGTQSVLLTAAILEKLARDSDPISISELAREIDASKSRIFRHLQTLAKCDFVVQDEVTGGYEVGARLLEICQTLNKRHDLLSAALPVLEELRRQTRHTSIVSRVDASGVHVLTSLSSDSPIILEVRPGTVLPFDRSAQGLVALAFSAAGQRDASGALGQAREAVNRTRPGELEAIRARGWAEARMRDGLLGKGAPILDARGQLIATLGLLDTETAMGRVRDQDTQHLLDAARRLERDLGAARAGPGD